MKGFASDFEARDKNYRAFQNFKNFDLRSKVKVITDFKIYKFPNYRLRVENLLGFKSNDIDFGTRSRLSDLLTSFQGQMTF